MKRFILPALVLLLSSSAALAESNAEPFSFADFTWAPGNYSPLETPLKTQYFTPELRLDTAYHYSFANPRDNTISGSSEVFRHNEFQATQIGVGGDVAYKNVGFRLMTQFGMYATATPRNDPSAQKGQWQSDNAYRYISEAYGTYHIDYDHGINVQTGIFMSYVGLWSYYNFDNWTYQPSFVSSNTPWYFNGIRVQYFPTERLKVETWLVNGWQAYNKFNEAPGLGLQVQWKPNGNWTIIGNQYYGADTLGTPGRQRLHSDDSLMYKYHENQAATVSKAAFSVTVDAGCEQGGGVSCGNQYFLGFMAYNRLWFLRDRFGLTVGGGAINNPGRYLVITPPVNGATAYTGAQDFSQASPPPQNFHAWDVQVTGDWMPSRNLTFRLEYTHRQADVPYFAGPGGVTPPDGSGAPVNGSVSGAAVPTDWHPDLVKAEDRVTLAMLIRL